MIQKVNSLSSNVYTSHGEILKGFSFFLKYVNLPTPCIANYDNSLENSSHTNPHFLTGVHPV